jgi:hypothetical protein
VAPEAAAYQAFAGGEAASRKRQLLKTGALGLTAVGLIGWLLRSTSPAPKPAAASDAAPQPSAPQKD